MLHGGQHLPRLALVAGLAVAGSASTSSVGDSASEGVMREYVAAQATSELALRSEYGSLHVSPESIRLERVPERGQGLEVWRATLPSDHSHPYLLAMGGGVVLRLGGFASPELLQAARTFPADAETRDAIKGRSEELALLADPNGANQTILTTTVPVETTTAVLRSWWQRAPKSWPRDTIVERRAEGWSVRLSSLSRDTRSFTLHWVPTAYSFEFDQYGALIAWDRRIGESFGVPGVPVTR